MRPLIVVLCAAALCSGCATPKTYVQTKSAQLQLMLAAGNFDAAVALARRDLNYDDSDSTLIRRELAKHPGAHSAVAQRLRSEVDTTTSPSFIEAFVKALALCERDGALTAEETRAIRQLLGAHIEAGVRTGAIPLDLTHSDLLAILPELNTPSIQQGMFTRTLVEARDSYEPRRAMLIERLFAVARGAGDASEQARSLRAALPTLKLTSSELRLHAIAFDSVQANRLLESRARRIAIRSEPADRLLEDDIKDLLKKRSDDFQFVATPSADALILTVGKLQYEERPEQERKQTITYAQHEVQLLAAVLLMPRNASFMYEHVSGGIDIASAYLIKIARGSSVIVDKVHRDHVTQRYSFCENARIANVFGGVQKAEFVANQDMANRCGAGSAARPDPNRLRVEIITRLADEIVSNLLK